MDVGAICQRVRDIFSARAAVAAGVSSDASLRAGLRAVAVLRAWLAAAEAELAAALAAVVSFPEQAIAEAGRGSQGDAGRVLERSGTLAGVPALAAGLNAGSVTAGHVDAVTKVARGLEGAQRAELVRRADSLVDLAEVSSAAEFRQRLEREARAVQSDDGMARFERQRSAVRLRRWTDGDGMWCLQGRFDPLTGVRLNARLDAELEAAFAESVPEGCPSDPIAKQQFLAAHALARLLDGNGVAPRAGRPEFVVVIDTTSGHDDDNDDTMQSGDPSAEDGPGGACGFASEGPTVDWGLPVEIPQRVLLELFGEAEVHAVIVRNGVVLHAPGELDLGRTTRLANRAQRRALRALYATCGIPGCATRFERCKIHHVRWWRHGGRTDLVNLLPVCIHHHDKVHHDGWVVTLTADRRLTIHYPDGSIQTTGPPHRRAA